LIEGVLQTITSVAPGMERKVLLPIV